MAKNVSRPQTAVTKPPGTPDNQIPNQICPHIHFRTDIIDREMLSRKQHLNLLCTPKGYRWVIKKNEEETEADRMNPAKHVFICADKRKKPGKTYVHNFLAEVWSLMTPEMVERLKEMLMNEFGMSPEESVRFICEQRMRTLEIANKHRLSTPQDDEEEEEAADNEDPRTPRVFFGDPKLCDKDQFAVGIDPCHIKEFSRIVSTKLSDYLIAMMCAKRDSRHRRMAEVILNGLCNVTGEKCTLDKPKNRLHKILTLVSDRTALWLAANIEDEDKKRENERRKEDAEIRKRQKEKEKEKENRKKEREKLEKEREKQERKKAKKEEEEARKAKEEEERKKEEREKRHEELEKNKQKKKEADDKKAAGKGDGDKKGGGKGDGKKGPGKGAGGGSKGGSQTAGDGAKGKKGDGKKSGASGGGSQGGKSKGGGSQGGGSQGGGKQGAKPKPAGDQPGKETAEKPETAKTEEDEAATDTGADETEGGETEGEGSEAAGAGEKKEDESAKPEETAPKAGESEEAEQKKEEAGPEKPEEAKPEEAKPEDTKTEQAKAEGAKQEEKPAEADDKKKKQEEKQPDGTKEAIKESISQIMKTEPVVTPRQEAIQDVISKELEKKFPPQDEETKQLIRELSAKTASWIDQKVQGVEKEYGIRDERGVPVTQKPKGPILSLRRSQDHVNVRRVTHTEAQKGIRETRGKIQPLDLDASKPMTPDDAKMWAKWAENASQMAENWGKWIDKTIQDAEEKTVKYKSKGKEQGKAIDVDKQDWESFTGKTLEEALEWRRNRKALEEMAAKWQKKSQK